MRRSGSSRPRALALAALVMAGMGGCVREACVARVPLNPGLEYCEERVDNPFFEDDTQYTKPDQCWSDEVHPYSSCADLGFPTECGNGTWRRPGRC